MRKIQWFIGCLLFLIAVSFANGGELEETLQKKVSPKFVGTSIQQVLRVFARQYSLNLVVGGDVTGNVTVQLNDVTLADALSAILKAHGYHYIIENNVILVKPFDQNVNGELTSKVYRLNYLDGNLLTKTLEPLLSSKGKIEPLIAEVEKEDKFERASEIVVTDNWENLARIDEVIKNLDTPITQVQIEVRLVETLLGNEKEIGFNPPKKISGSITGGETTAPITKSQQSGGGQRRLAAWYKLPTFGKNFHYGVLTIDELTAALDFLSRDTHSHLISSPKVTALNNRKATIRIGTSVPVPEVSRGISGDLLSFKEKQVDMNLEVIPRINSAGYITMDVHPILEEIIGFTGPSDTPQPITSRREVQTTVMVKNGETAVIGGLIKENTKEITDKVWLLGDIPLLGLLFRHKSSKKEKTDLLIFITPKIISATGSK